MSVLNCGQVSELAPELALDVLTGAERAEAVAHINECSRCRNLLADLSAAADTLALLVPEAEPPSGFEERVLAALDPRRQQRRSRLRQVGALAFVAAAACIVTLVLVRVAVRPRDDAVTAPVEPAADVSAAPMVAAADRVVGQVFVTSGDRAWAYVFVNYGQMAAGSYRVEIEDAGGSRAAGSLQIVDGQGAWAGVIPEPGDGATIALVDADGTQVCRGALA
jgi:hypothetical protein